MKKRKIISLAVDEMKRRKNSHRFRNASRKLRKSLNTFHIGDSKIYTGYPPGCPKHSNNPYAFKPFVINKAREDGYDQVLWIDAACIVKKRLDPIWNILDKQGYYIQLNGWQSGEWASDDCLRQMNVTRDEAMLMPHAMANVMGFDFTNPIAEKLFNTWHNHGKMGTFNGDWKNDKQQCSQDPRCLGFRHDQTVISILASQAGLNFTDCSANKLLSYKQSDGYVIHAAGA